MLSSPPPPLRPVVIIVLCACMLTSSTACGIRTSRAGLQAQPSGGAPGGPRWITREYAEKLPVGTKVKVERKNGDSFTATFMGVEGDAVRIQKRTRIPEPPLLIPLEELVVLALDTGGGIGAAKAAVVGVVTGVGTFFFVLLLAAAAWD